MYRKLYPWMLLVLGLLTGLVASGRMALRAQDRVLSPVPDPSAPGGGELRGPAVRPGLARAVEPGQAGGLEPPRAGQASVQDVLLRPYRFPFSRPTSLAQVCLHLKQTLGVPVVLDVAAMDRQNVDPESAVQLELDGVRLKTGLKLLLDQVGLTFHAIPEDNLLIITDRQGSDDPLDRVWNELRTVHRELHDVQDAVEALTDALYSDQPEGARVRKPTIIEEKPDEDAANPGGAPGEKKEPKAPVQKPGSVEPPDHPRGFRPSPSRIPLAHRRKTPRGVSQGMGLPASRTGAGS